MAPKKPKFTNNSRGRSNTRQNNNKRNQNYKDEIIDDRKEGSNDIADYGSPDFIKAAAQLNFTNPLGKPIGYQFYSGSDTSVTYNLNRDGVTSAPGVMGIGIASVPGWCSTGADVGNIFARNFYAWIRHQNSGHANYDAPDMAHYVLAINEIHAMIQHCIRIYGIARTYSSMNRYMPETVLSAMGVDVHASGADLYQNLAAYRAALLNLMVKAGTFVIPDDFKFNKHYRECFTSVYMDGETSKSQLYVFRPSYYRVYEAAATPRGGKLVAKACNETYNAWTWLGFIDEMLRGMVGNEDMNIMSGDILKAYGADKVYKLPYFDENYTVFPVYNPEILLEIHNLKLVGTPWTTDVLDITQDPDLGIILCTPYFNASTMAHGGICPILDMPVENPNPAQIITACRYTNVGGVAWDSTAKAYKYTPHSLMSEVVTQLRMVYKHTDANGKWVDATDNLRQAFNGGLATSEQNMISRLQYFGWHPNVYFVTIPNTSDRNTVQVEAMGNEIDNYTVVDVGTLSRIHDAALVGLFRVPLMGTWETKFTK